MARGLADGRRRQRHVKVNDGDGERALDVVTASDKFLKAAQMHPAPRSAKRAREAVLALDTTSWRETAATLVMA
jgi:hypothetical protein